MNDAERFEATRSFIAALSLTRSDSDNAIPFDPVQFADVVHKLRQQGNAFAGRFPIYNTVDGKSCPDFQLGMTAAQSAGLISRQNPSYQSFSVRMPPRVAKQALAREAESESARELAEEYYSSVAG